MSTRSFTVGWICALQEEYDVACRMLDEELDDLEDDDLDPTDNNAYTFGTIGNHRVVIGCLPEGRYGTISAARVARDISRSFPNVRFCLMVGIGGGAPTEENDIRLGDVVVSVPNKMCSGVVQYDCGKRLPAGDFVQTGQLNAPPEVLLGAIRKIRRVHNDPVKADRIAEHTKRMDDYHPAYVRPVEDYLYRSDYHHVGGERTCNSCSKEMLISRPNRQQSARQISVHYGTIASGNSVIKDAQLRDRYARGTSVNVLCFEMEAAGLMNDIPCLIIRGICDYSDSHKNDDWHKYAALTAAAYAREVLLILRPRQVDAMPPWAEKINQITQEVMEVKSVVVGTSKAVDSMREDAHINAIRTWLAPPDSSANLAKAQATRYGGTGLWFLDNDIFQKWELGKCQHLWLHGIPGSGKTVLTSSIIDYLYKRQEINSPKKILLTFFFDFTDSSKSSLDHLLRSLIMQLYLQSSKARPTLDSLFYQSKTGQRQTEISSPMETFLTMSRKTDKPIQIVIDALDECTVRQGLLRWIKGIITSHSDHGIQLVVSSRMEADIEFAFSTTCLRDNRIPIEQSIVNTDIKAFIHGTLRGENEFQRWSSQPEILSEIEVELMNKAGGMFRWVSCQLDVLQKCVHLRALRKALASLPETLDETYARILGSIELEHKDDAIRLLQFLCFSERPLTIAEAVDAIAVNIDDEKPYFDLKERMPRPHEVARICSSLLSVTQAIGSNGSGTTTTMTIQLAHSSVKEYLMSDLVDSSFRTHLGELQARATITRVCLTYLDYVHLIPPQEGVRTSFPLATYAATYWTEHAQIAEAETETLMIIIDFFLTKDRAWKAWRYLFDPDEPWNEYRLVSSTKVENRLYYAARFGLVRTSNNLLDKGAEIDALGRAYGTALQAACIRGHVEVVRLLLSRGADANARGGRYRDALCAACFRGDETIVKLLLDAGAHWEASDPLGALKVACDLENARIVEMLLEKDKKSVKWAQDTFAISSDKIAHFDLKEMAKTLCRRSWPNVKIVDTATYGIPNHSDRFATDHNLILSLLSPITPGLDVIEDGYIAWKVDALKSQESPLVKLHNNSKHTWQIKLDYKADSCSLYLAFASGSSSISQPSTEGPVDFAFVIWKADEPSRFVARGTKYYFHSKQNAWGFREFCPQGSLIDTLGGGLSSTMNGVNINGYLRLLGVRGPRYRPIGLKNQGTTGWLSVIMQLVYHIKVLRKTIYRIPTARQDKTDIAWALQRLFYSMQTSKNAVSTRELTDAFGWKQEDLLPRDVQDWQSEFHYHLDVRMASTPLKYVRENLVAGQTTSYVSSPSSKEKGTWRQECFEELCLNVRTFRSLNEGLQNFIQPWYSNYESDNANILAMFDRFPPILNLQLKRFEYDISLDSFTKVDDFFEFPEEIDLGSFVKGDDTTSQSEPWIYRLVSVVVHEGTVSGGVYYVYVRPEKDGNFFRIHDEQVTPVTLSEVFEAGYGGDGCGNSQGWSRTATVLCYCRKSRLDEIFVDITDDDIPASIHD